MSSPRPNKKQTPPTKPKSSRAVSALQRDLFLAALLDEDISGWSVHSHPPQLLAPSGKKYPLTWLGAGSFATAYEVDNHSVVVAEVHDVGGKPLDVSKTILAEILSEHPDAVHLPHVVYLGTTGVSELFGMPKYTVPIDAKKSPTAWRQAITLRNCSDRAQSDIDHKFVTHGYVARAKTVACAKRSRVLPATLTRDLEALSNYADKFGKSTLFEFPPQNLGTDEHGNLILLDVLFDIKVLRTVRKLEKAMKNRNNPGLSPLAGWFDHLLSPAVTPG